MTKIKTAVGIVRSKDDQEEERRTIDKLTEKFDDPRYHINMFGIVIMNLIAMFYLVTTALDL